MTALLPLRAAVLHLALLGVMTAALGAVDTIASGVYSAPADEDTPKNLTYGLVRGALVSGDGGTSTYRYRIKTLGSSTLFLKDSGGSPVVLGTTVLMPTASSAGQTTSLQYQAIANEFTRFPTTSAWSKDPVAVCVVDVLSSDGSSTVAADITLSIDIQGAYDMWHGEIFTTTPIPLVYGVPTVLTYEQLRSHTTFRDIERDAEATLALTSVFYSA